MTAAVPARQAALLVAFMWVAYFLNYADRQAVFAMFPSLKSDLGMSDKQLGLAATVAYEHHVMIDGGGYPHFHFPRSCHYASRLVHVCDVFDAFRTDRPYRAAWTTDAALDYIEQRAGTEFDPEIARAFAIMMRRVEVRPTPFEDLSAEPDRLAQGAQ